MRVVLDTSALFYPEALVDLESRPDVDEIVLPAVVFLERARQLSRAGYPGVPKMALLVERGGLTVEAFDVTAAARSATLAPLDDARWGRLSRDAIVAGHVRTGDELWTANPKDFRMLGLPAEQVRDVGAKSNQS